MHPRAKLIFPLTEQVMRADLLSVSPWQEVDEDVVGSLGCGTAAALPEFQTSQLYMVAGPVADLEAAARRIDADLSASDR
jgi:hypothetical protein